MLDLLLHGGLVATEPPTHADIGVRDGRIAGLYEPGAAPAATQTLDASGCAVLPGLLDAHVHPGVYRDLADDLRDITRFAALGGITSMVAFYRPTEAWAGSVPAGIDTFASNSYLDFGFILGLTRERHIEEIPIAIRDFGVNAFKYYLGYCGHEERFHADFSFTDDWLIRVLETLRDQPTDPLLCVHCENAQISGYYQETLRHQAEDSLRHFERTNPVVSELDAAAHVSLLAHSYGVRACVVHVSAGTTAGALRSLPWHGDGRTVLETCPHYLCVDVDDPSGLRAVVRPPVRERAEVESLWGHVLDGAIDTLGSDNCANDLEEKARAELARCAFGFGEMGLTLPLMLTEGHHKRGLPLPRIAAMTSTNVAKAHGLYPRKGSLLPGADADLVAVDLDAERTVDPLAVKGRPDGSVYDGRTLRGWPVTTIAHGEVIVRDGTFVGELGRARHLRPAAAASI
ncbi:MAG: dihydroorotase [Streptosporangiaceae bacterium]